MRFAIEQKFGITADTLPCRDPWGFITFQVLRPTSRKAKEREKARQKGDPVAVLAVSAAVRQGMGAATKKPAPKLVNGSAELLPPEGAPTAAQEQGEDFAEVFGREVSQALDKGTISPFDLLSRDRELEEALDLVDGWDATYEDGSAVPCTRESVRELLTSDTLVSEGNEYAGKTVGDAYIEILLAFARKHDEARQKYIEQGGKASEQPSAGN